MAKVFRTTVGDTEAYIKVNNDGIICYVSFEENGSGAGIRSENGKLFEKLLKTALNFMCKNDPNTLKSILNEIYRKDLLHYEFIQSILEQKKKEEKMKS